jgi:hypothetical protein
MFPSSWVSYNNVSKTGLFPFPTGYLGRGEGFQSAGPVTILLAPLPEYKHGPDYPVVKIYLTRGEARFMYVITY